MNGNDIFRAMNGLNDKFIISANSEQTVKQGRKPAKSIFRIAVGIAAAAAFAIPVGAYAYNTLIHRDKVSIYYTEEGVQKLEENGLVSNRTIENGQIRLTIDTEICDGNYTSGLYTITALTDEAKEHIETVQTRLVYADTGEEIPFTVGVLDEDVTSEAANEYEQTRGFVYPVNSAHIDRSRPMRLEFWEWKETGEFDGYNPTVEKVYGFFEGIYFDLLTEPNVTSKVLRSDEGIGLILNPYGVISLPEDWKYPDGYDIAMDILSFVVISTDGERVELMNDGRRLGWSGTPEKGNFDFNWGNILDVENISGVEINGVEYMAE